MINPTISKSKRICISVRDVRAQVWDACGGYCYYCHNKMNPFRDFTIDHKTPTSRGGSNDLDNIVGCCQACNSAKMEMLEGEFRRRARLLATESYEQKRQYTKMSIALNEVADQLYTSLDSVEDMMLTLKIKAFRLGTGEPRRIWRNDFNLLKAFLNAARSVS